MCCKTTEKPVKEGNVLMNDSAHCIYGYMASVIWYRITLIVRGNCCYYMGYSFQLGTRVLLCASSPRQDSTYHSITVVVEHWLQWEHHEGSSWWPIAPYAGALLQSYILLPIRNEVTLTFLETGATGFWYRTGIQLLLHTYTNPVKIS